MDTTSVGIQFDSSGVCSHCQRFDSYVRPQLLNSQQKTEGLKALLDDVKLAGKGLKYDCLIGLSGGVDSSYVVYLAKKHGLRPIIVHFDNGWDSELAVRNIESIIKNTGFDYYNYIVDWEEFRDIQRAYFKASVVDVEVPTDMGIQSLIPRLAIKFNVPFVLFGENIETESTMGYGWNFDKMDRSNFEDIYKKYGGRPLKTFPYLSPLLRLRFKFKKIKLVNILAFDECNYFKIKELLNREFGWRDYGVKHGESVFTKFYQSYYLLKKFGFDKRRAHLCDQINSGHIQRQQALAVLDKPVYLSLEDEKNELEYVINKLGFSEKEFSEILNLPCRTHSEFKIGKMYGSFIDKVFLILIGAIKKLRGYFVK
jgi:N-acetyl sugar amidotransferase